MQNKGPLSFLGIENHQKENPEKCRNNFLLICQFAFYSKIDFMLRFKEIIKRFEKSHKYLKYFDNNVELKNFYIAAFQENRYFLNIFLKFFLKF